MEQMFFERNSICIGGSGSHCRYVPDPGKSAEIIMALVVIISTFGCNNGMVISGPRLYYAMAKDEVFSGQPGD